MEQLVHVRETYPDGTASVIHVRESACSGDCHKCSGCGAAKESIILKASNPLGARMGDRVTIESATGPVLKAAMVLYVLPLVLFFVGYPLGAVFLGQGALIGCLAFCIGIVFVVLYDRRISRDKPAYTITAIVNERREDFQMQFEKEKGDNDFG